MNLTPSNRWCQDGKRAIWDGQHRTFSEEISTYVSPMVRRFCESDYLSTSEYHEFIESCYSQVNELRDLIKEKEAEAKQPKKGIWA